MRTPDNATMTFGVIIFVSTLAAWLFGEFQGVDTTILWAVATPVVMALFVGGQLGRVAESSAAAATQTNGSMSERIKAAVSSALADRDAARTRQSQGDVSHPAPAVVVNTQTAEVTPPPPSATRSRTTPPAAL